LRGEYGAAPAPVNEALQNQVLDGAVPITCRPADLLKPEFDKLKAELLGLEKEKNLKFNRSADGSIDDDVLIYALFPQPGLKFLANRDNPDAFEPHPEIEEPAAEEPSVPTAEGVVNDTSKGAEIYNVEVQGQQYIVRVSPGGDLQPATPVAASAAASASPAAASGTVGITAPLSGNVFKVNVKEGDRVENGDIVLVMEAMKMETEIRSTSAGQVIKVLVREGDTVSVSQTLITLG